MEGEEWEKWSGERSEGREKWSGERSEGRGEVEWREE